MGLGGSLAAAHLEWGLGHAEERLGSDAQSLKAEDPKSEA